MKNLKQLTRAFAVHALIFSLMQTSFIFQVNAASIDKTEITGKEILSVANIAVQTYGQFLGQKQQMISQQIAAQRNQALMQSLSPSCRKADGTACYTTAGKFFPECPIPASMSSMPQNVCSAASPDPSAISSMITYESIAKGWVNYFEQMQNEASNSTTPFGMKCLGDKKKALDSQLTEMQNNLTRLQDQLNKDKETFKANNKKLLDEMTTTNDELVGAQGGSGKNNLKIKTKDFAKYFSQSCQSVIGEENLANGTSLGLLGIMQSLSSTNKRAADYNSNRALIESDVRRDIEKNQKLIADGGLDDFLAKNPSETTKYGSVAVAVAKQASEFKLAKDRIAKELSKIGYTLPPIDKNFSADFDTFLSGSQEFFRKQYVNDCVTGADKSGTAISTDQILASLKQRSTNSEGTARDKYKAALKTILDSDAFIEDKLTQIKALETNYKDITITYQNSSAQRVTSTPYDLYMKTLTACENRYKQDDTFSSSAQGVSQKKKVERGQDLLRELKSLNDNYTSQLGSRVLEQTLSCNGEAKKSGAACGGKDSFDTANVNFCMAQASQCANEVQGCYAEADKQVQTRKTKLEAMAKTFNANTAVLVARSNALYTAQKNAVMDMVKVVQARFPGTNFPIPADMFITMPEMKKDAFGVDMANDGNLAFMDELPKKIDLLKKVFKDQQASVDKEIDDYIDKQNQAMSKEKDKWDKLAGECKNMIDTSSREIAKMNNENLKKQGEMDQKVKNFCRKYAALASHPVGGCENAKKLSGEMDDVMSRIVPTVSTNVAEFTGVCNAYGNESNDPPSACGVKSPTRNDDDACDKEKARIAAAKAGKNAPATSSGKGINLSSICGKSNSNVDLVGKILAKLPERERSKFSSKESKDELVKAFSTGDFDSVDGYDSLLDGGIFQNLKGLVGDLKDNEKVCDKLNNMNTKTAAGAKLDPEQKKAALTKAQSAYDEAKSVATKASIKLDLTAEEKKAEDDSKVALEAKAADKRSAEETAKLNKIIADATARDTATKAKAALATAQSESDAATAGAQPTKRDELQKVLAEFDKAANVSIPVAEVKAEELNRIGEQIDTNTVCDSQAANTNVSKAFSGSLLPSGFDEKILGIAK